MSKSPPKQLAPARALEALTKSLRPGEIPPLAMVRRAYVQAALDAHGGNKCAAANDLGISRHSIYRWLGASAE